MILGERVLGLIPARGGSKGLPGKNIMHLGGIPLVVWTIRAAQASRFIDNIVLSSDDPLIMNVARDAGCDVPFSRPPELATDHASSVDVALHALEKVEGYDWLVLLQPTSPLRTANDIDAAIELCSKSKADSCVSVSEVSESPYWMYRLDREHRLSPLIPPQPEIVRRQDLPPIYALNGAVYLIRVDTFRAMRRFVHAETVAHVMPRERSIDIDTLEDFETASRLVSAASLSV